SAFPGPKTELGTRWLHAPLLGIAARIRSELPFPVGDVVRFYVGVTGALILLAAITTSVSGFSRLAYSLGEHGQLPRSFGRLRRREVPLPAIVGSILTFSIWIVAMATHPGARYAGPAWLALGLVIYVLVRRSRGEGLMERVRAVDELPYRPGVHFKRILVPMK